MAGGNMHSAVPPLITSKGWKTSFFRWRYCRKSSIGSRRCNRNERKLDWCTVIKI